MSPSLICLNLVPVSSASEGYWDTGKPTIDTVEIQFLSGDPETNARRVLKTGDADYASVIEQVPSDTLLPMAQESTIGRLVSLPGKTVETLFLNFADPRDEPEDQRSEPHTAHPLLSDPRVRRAISLAIPRDRLAEAYGSHQCEPFIYPLALPEMFRGSGVPPKQDMDRARALLNDAGFEGGALLIQTSVNSFRQQAQEIIAGALEGLGFIIELNAVDAGVFFSSDPDNPDTASHFYADLQLFTPATRTLTLPARMGRTFPLRPHRLGRQRLVRAEHLTLR